MSKITNDGLTRSDTRCFIAAGYPYGNSGRQSVKNTTNSGLGLTVEDFCLGPSMSLDHRPSWSLDEKQSYKLRTVDTVRDFSIFCPPPKFFGGRFNAHSVPAFIN